MSDEKVMAYGTVEEKKAARAAFLNRFYDLAEGSQQAMVNFKVLGDQLGLSPQHASDVAEYLRGEYLIEHRALGGDHSLTHAGVREVEELRSEPDLPTEHFPPLAVVNHFVNHGTMTGVAVQQAGSGLELTQSLTQIAPFNEFVSLARQLADEISDPQVAAYLVDTAAKIESEASLESPSGPRLAGMIEATKQLALGVSGSLFAAKILELAPLLLAVL